MAISKSVLDHVRLLVPQLTPYAHKGQNGRVGVVGGSQEYTGAPFFSAMSALRMGADLAHVMCSPSAATAIKSYSPDIIVHPLFSTESNTMEVTNALKALLNRLHVLVIGPGLGRAPHMQSYARLALSLAKDKNLYVVLDADALWMIQNDPDLIRGYRRAVITPNLVEFKRLCEAVKIPPESTPGTLASLLSAQLGGVTVLQKGQTDVITFSFSSPTSGERERAEVVTKGGLKRCGGQGDILTGVLGTMLCWGKAYEEATEHSESRITSTRIPLLASVGSAIVTRVASRRGFDKHGRALVTQDILQEVEGAFLEVFEAQEDNNRRAYLQGQGHQ